VFEFEKPPRQRYLSDLTDLAWQRLRHLLVRPHPRGAAMPRVALARVGRRDLVRQPYRLHLGNGAHDFAVSWSATHKHFLRWTRDGT
jgi:hypothetical protein